MGLSVQDGDEASIRSTMLLTLASVKVGKIVAWWPNKVVLPISSTPAKAA